MDSNIENIINISNTIIRTFLHTFIDDVVNAAVGLDLEVFFFFGRIFFRQGNIRTTPGKYRRCWRVERRVTRACRPAWPSVW